MVMNYESMSRCCLCPGQLAVVIVVMCKSSNVITVLHMLLQTMCVLDIAHIKPNITFLQDLCIPGAAKHSLTTRLLSYTFRKCCLTLMPQS